MQTPNASETAVTLLQTVNEDWKAFWFSHGAVAKNLQELRTALDDMNADEFAYHVNAGKNDLAEWVESVVGDTTLSIKLRLLSTLEATRRMVGRRVDELTAQLPVHAPAVAETPVAETAVATASVTETVAAPKAVKKTATKAKKMAKKVTAKAVAAKKYEAPTPKKTSLFGRFLKR